MTPDDTRKDPGVAKTRAALPREKKELVEAEALKAYPTLTEAMQINPYAAMQQVNPWAQAIQQNLGMTTQVLPGVAGAQTFNAQALTQSAAVPNLLTRQAI